MEAKVFCPNCGTQMKGGATFCPECGARVQASVSHEQGSNDDVTVEKSPKPTFLSTTKGKVILIGGIAAVAVMGFLVYSMFFKYNSPIYDPPIYDPPVSLDVKSGYVVGDKATDNLSNSKYAPNDGYVITSVSEDNRHEFEEGNVRYCTISSTIEYENGSLKATKHVDETFKMQKESNEWVQFNVSDDDAEITPINGVDSDLVKESIPTLIESVDDNPKKDAEGYAVLLRDCYKEGASFDVKENKTTDNGGDVIVSLHASRGFADYNETLTASFAWEGNSWVLESCKVDDAAYQPDYSSLVGTWKGEFLKTEHNDVMGQAACYGGKKHPMVLTVKSVDNQAKTATADLSVLVHDHDIPENATEEYAGDTFITREGIIFPINPDGEVKVYQSEDPTSFHAHLRFDEGAMYMRSYVEASFAKDHGVSWREDSYKMAKQEG